MLFVVGCVLIVVRCAMIAVYGVMFVVCGLFVGCVLVRRFSGPLFVA